MPRCQPKISEKHIQETCDAFLELDGWRVIKTDLAHLRGLGVQEPGMCDRLYVRYRAIPVPVFVGEASTANVCDVLWIEWKAKKGVHSQKQKDWQAKERACGALVWVAKQDFEASIEAFQEFYRNSGLMRRRLT